MSDWEPKSSHWYTFDGLPMHFVPNKSKPGEMRPATIKDARELLLMPSTTGMTGMLEKWALTQWKIRESIKLAISMFGAGQLESMDAFVDRVMKEPLSDAAEWGTGLHKELEDWMKGHGKTFQDPPLMQTFANVPHLEGFKQWAVAHNLRPLFYNGHVLVEVSFCNVEGAYAGTFDFKGFIQPSAFGTACSCGCAVWGFGKDPGEPIYVLIDYKTQATKPGKAVNFWPDWGPQLASYDHGSREISPLLHGQVAADTVPIGDAPVPLKMSVVVSSTEPGRVESRAWDDEETDWCWEAFRNLRGLYYSPLGPGNGLPWRPQAGC